MGIQGLLPFMQSSSRKVNMSEYAGCTVAIDGYCWLHKGAFSCAEKLARGEQTDQYVTYCMKFVNMLLSHNIKPILVFDGCHLPAKADTEKTRRERREANRKRAGELLRLDRGEEARSLLRRCVDVTHDMAHSLIVECRNRNVDCIVAPFEADAQLAYLNITGIAHLVITEDSDLMLFGCTKVVFKMDVHGNGLLIEQDKLPLSMKMRPDSFNLDKFRNMCILSGCDYLQSLPGIGLQKALKFIKQTAEVDIVKVLPKLGAYLNKPGLIVSEEYKHGFEQAMDMFKHQPVFDPRLRKIVPLTPLPPGVRLPVTLPHSADTFYQIALGNIDPISLKVVDKWNPDQQLLGGVTANSRGWNARAKHPSFWSKDFVPPDPSIPQPSQDPRVVSKPSTFGKKASVTVENLEMRLAERKLNADESIEVFAEMCKETVTHTSNCSKSPNLSDEENLVSLDEILEQIERNPSSTPSQPQKGLLAKINKTQLPDDSHTIKSKYFFAEPEKREPSHSSSGNDFNADDIIKQLIKVGKISPSKAVAQKKSPSKILSPVKGSIFEITKLEDTTTAAEKPAHKRNIFSVTNDPSLCKETTKESSFFSKFVKTSTHVRKIPEKAISITERMSISSCEKQIPRSKKSSLFDQLEDYKMESSGSVEKLNESNDKKLDLMDEFEADRTISNDRLKEYRESNVSNQPEECVQTADTLERDKQNPSESKSPKKNPFAIGKCPVTPNQSMNSLEYEKNNSSSAKRKQNIESSPSKKESCKTPIRKGLLYSLERIDGHCDDAEDLNKSGYFELTSEDEGNCVSSPTKNPFKSSSKSPSLKSPSIFGKRKEMSPIKVEEEKKLPEVRKTTKPLCSTSLFRWTKPLAGKSVELAENLISNTPPSSQDSDIQEIGRLPKVAQYLGPARNVGLKRKRGSSTQKSPKCISKSRPANILTMYGFKQKDKLKT